MANTAGTLAPLLVVVDGRPTTTSIDVAEFFKKRHDNVLRDIENLVSQLPEKFRLLNFEETSNIINMPNGGTRTETAYRLTKDGFTLLAMGFTGEEALRFKLVYIEAFNQMEATLHQKESLPDLAGLKWLLTFNPDGQPVVEQIPANVFVKMEILLQTAQALLRRLYGHESYQERDDKPEPPKLPPQPLTGHKRLPKTSGKSALIGQPIQRLIVINGQRVLQAKNEDGSWDNEHVSRAGALPPGVYNLFEAAPADASRRYKGLILYTDKAYIYQLTQASIIRHGRKKFHPVPARATQPTLSYDTNGSGVVDMDVD
jgi:Rha family phage regulatory protein